jgi:hypothetical protein
MNIPVSVRLTTNGLEQNVLLNKQLVGVEYIELKEVLAVGWNGGVSSGAYLRIHHNQLNDISISDRPQAGAMLLVDVLNPWKSFDGKIIAKGQIGNLNGFRISVSLVGGAPATFTELYLIFHVRCTQPDPNERIPNAMQDIPQMKGADPRQTRFLQ